ncbi:sensor histidine kinase [Nostocoides veronense]|uniref:sensor histidine kinase n=1 Tax=Nostocoides veronense TaxID=330836 RepID=UPI0031DE8FCF
MPDDPLVLVPLVAWLATGLAAVALTPRQGAARALCAAGVLIFAAWMLEEVAVAAVETGAGNAVLNAVADGVFVAKTAAVIALLALMPTGRFTRRWHGWLVVAAAATSVLSTFLRVVGSARIDVASEPSLAVTNPHAIAALADAGALGEALVDAEPLLFLAGIAMLAHRWWRERQHRPVLGRMLLGIGALAVLLVLVVLGESTSLPHLVPQHLFLLALASFPVLLLVDLSAQARALQRELSESRARIVTAEDQARRSIERDLHDGVQQQLVGILTLTELAARQSRRDPAASSATLDEIRDEVQAAISGLRELVSGIRPPALADGGLPAALNDRFARLQESVTLEVSQSAAGHRWPPQVEAALYFVACEAVTNALKHAPSSMVRISLTATERGPLLQVADTGPGVTTARPGAGLRGMQDRIESLGGRFELASASGGTVLTASVPGEPV